MNKFWFRLLENSHQHRAKLLGYYT